MRGDLPAMEAGPFENGDKSGHAGRIHHASMAWRMGGCALFLGVRAARGGGSLPVLSGGRREAQCGQARPVPGRYRCDPLRSTPSPVPSAVLSPVRTVLPECRAFFRRRICPAHIVHRTMLHARSRESGMDRQCVQEARQRKQREKHDRKEAVRAHRPRFGRRDFSRRRSYCRNPTLNATCCRPILL